MAPSDQQHGGLVAACFCCAQGSATLLLPPVYRQQRTSTA